MDLTPLDSQDARIARIESELKLARLQQEATADVLRLVSDSYEDEQPVLDAIVSRCASLISQSRVSLWLVREGKLERRARDGELPSGQGAKTTSTELSRESVMGTCVLDSTLIHIPDTVGAVDRYPMLASPIAQGFGAILVAPLVGKGSSLGVIMAFRPQAGSFSESEIHLLKTFADQAVIAIENVRLFKDTREALEQQTATAEVLRVISNSLADVQPVFDAIVESCSSLFPNSFVTLRLVHGAILRRYARSGSLSVIGQPTEIPLDRASALGTCVLESRSIHIPDLQLQEVVDRYPTVRKTLPQGWRSLLLAPLMADGGTIGVISIIRTMPGAFRDNEVKLLKTFADQAVIAMENARLFNETKEALEQQTATADVLKVISQSTTDITPVFEMIVRAAKELGDAEAAAAFRFDGTTIHYVTSVGVSVEQADLMRRTTPRPPDRTFLSGRVVLDRAIVRIDDATLDAEYDQSINRNAPGRRLVGVPMLQDGKPIGSLNVVWREPGTTPDKYIRMLQTFADQAVIAIENVRLFNEIQDKSRQLEEANKHKSEFLANMSHELRTPLNAIIGFSEVMMNGMAGEISQDQREFVTDIRDSGKHLLTLINDILDLSKIEAGRMELDVSRFDIPEAIENAMTLIRGRANLGNVTLAAEIAPEVGECEGDARKFKQIVLNLLSNAVKFTPDGGSVTLSARRVDGNYEVSVTDTGIGIALEDQDKVFEEFRQVGSDPRKAEGTGLGLTLTRRLVELHGGVISLDSAPGRGSTFTFTLPIGTP